MRMRALIICLVGFFLLYFVCEGDSMNIFFGALGPHASTKEVIPNLIWNIFEGKTDRRSSKRNVYMKKYRYSRDNVPLVDQSGELSDKIRFAIKLNKTVLTPKGLSPGYLTYIREQKNKMKKLVPRRHNEEMEMKPNRGLLRKRTKLRIPVLTLPSWMERLGFGKGYTDEDLPFLMDFEQDSSWETNKKKDEGNVEIIQGNLMFI